MFFKNLCVFRLPGDWNLPAAELEALLEQRPLTPCGHFDMSSRGWVPVGKTARLLHSLGSQQLVALGVEQKLLPASIIRQEATDRAVEIAIEQGYPVGRKQMRDLKLRITEELRARALVKRRVTHAWLDRDNGWFIVDSAGGARADEMVETMRETLGSFAVVPVETERSPQAAMASWLALGHVGNHFGIDEDLELTAADQSKATIRYSRHQFDSQEIRRHLSGGFTATKLGLTWNSRISFVLTSTLQVKRIEFVGMEETRDDAQDVDPQEEFDVEFALMSGELARLLADLLAALGLPGQQAAA
ncbi:MAG: recombination-associated protein RdgC [Steroidobacteraceae bacterium]